MCELVVVWRSSGGRERNGHEAEVVGRSPGGREHNGHEAEVIGVVERS
jgi:hypothetical protein